MSHGRASSDTHVCMCIHVYSMSRSAGRAQTDVTSATEFRTIGRPLGKPGSGSLSVVVGVVVVVVFVFVVVSAGAGGAGNNHRLPADRKLQGRESVTEVIDRVAKTTRRPKRGAKSSCDQVAHGQPNVHRLQRMAEAEPSISAH